MTNFKQYFRAHLKANIRSLIYILAIALLLTALNGINVQPIEYHDYETGKMVSYYSSMLTIPVMFMCILVYVLPVREFSFFKKRINLDCVYSLPISRRAMGTVHYLTGLITLFSAFTSSYLLNFVLLFSQAPQHFNFPPMVAHYFLCLLLGTAIYSLMVFVFNEANTKGDGIWFMLLYTYVFSSVASAVSAICDYEMLAGFYAETPWGAFGALTETYRGRIEIGGIEELVFWRAPGYVAWIAFWIALGIAAAAGFFLIFGKRRMDKTGEISNSNFGFRTLIPVYAASEIILTRGAGWFFTNLMAFFGYAIYRRGFHHKKSDIIVLVVLSIFGILLTALFA